MNNIAEGRESHPLFSRCTPLSTDADKRHVVCAAAKTLAGQIVPSARHGDTLMHSLITALGANFSRCTQGFIDQYGVFMSRQEAWKVAEAAWQIRKRVEGDATVGGTLYSENLY